MIFLNETAATDKVNDKINPASDLQWLITALIFAFAIMLPVLFWGIPSGHDLKHHFQCAIVFYDSIQSGDWFPNWAGNVNYGFGDVGARLYPPVGYYVLAISRILTGSWYGAGQGAFIFWMLLGVLGMYMWARACSLSPKYAALAGALYTMAPYHLARVYQLFLYAEFAGASILPFCFLFTVRILRSDKRDGGKKVESFGNVIGLAVSFGLLALTHIPLTLIATIGVLMYAVLINENWFWKNPRAIIKIFVGIGFGMLAAAWQWIKIITEMNWVNIGVEPLPEKYLYYKNHFFPLYFSTRENWYIARQLFLIDSITVLTLIIALVPVAALLVWRYRKRCANSSDKLNTKNDENNDLNKWSYRNLKAVSVIGLAAFFLITLPSIFIWQIVPILQKIQFPWRWLSLVAVVGTLGFAAGIEYLMQGGKKTVHVTGYVMIVVLFLVGLFNLTQSILPLAPVERGEFDTLMSTLPEEFSLVDWWTIWAKRETFLDRRKVAAENGTSVQITNWKNEEREFEVSNNPVQTVLRVATLYYPYWQAEVNGEPTQVVSGEDGTINLKVPPGNSHVKLFFREPPLVKAASIVSALTWIFLLIVSLAEIFRQRWKRS